MNDEAKAAAAVVNYIEVLKHVFLLALVGAAVGLGQLLAEQAKPNRRTVAGRFLASGGLGLASGGILAWMPDLPLIAQCGIAAAMASLGTSGLTLMFQRFLNK